MVAHGHLTSNNGTRHRVATRSWADALVETEEEDPH